MPIDFIDQLSKFEKYHVSNQNAVCNCGVSEGSVNTL
jgi:hypothetical protein